ncbi:MAG: hypothetical protein WD049_02470, partial [Candidatus Paceibacterota bacterium]
MNGTKCRVFGWDDASNDPHRQVMAALVLGFDHSDATVLCEPSLARTSKRPPDLVLVDATAGLHVIEVKGHDLQQIEAIEPGGQLRFRYELGSRTRNPVAQVRGAMFEVKNATEQAFDGELVLPFKYWVAFPRISRSDWRTRWGDAGFCPAEFLFSEDMVDLAGRLRTVGEKQLANLGLESWPADQVAAVWQAFGDSSVLYHQPEDREARRVDEGTLGEFFDDAAETYKTLSDDQQRLSAQNWAEGPRLIRGVAGSGKTIVLANNLARRLQCSLRNQSLFDDPTPTRLLAVCNNRSLVPFLKKKIGLAFQQRTGQPVPDKGLDIFSYNRLMWHLSQKGLWNYQKVEAASDELRATRYLAELQETKRLHGEMFDAAAYDAIFVDEGQDFLEEDFRLLKELCHVAPGHEPNIYVFYDDAQNFLGRKRPNWLSLGLNVRGGRANVMSQCFRNTQPIVEAAFNLLYGTMANGAGQVPTKEFGDIASLEEKNLVSHDDGFWRVGFAVRAGHAPRLSMANSPAAEVEQIVTRLRWLIEQQRVRPQDILVLSMTKKRIESIAKAVDAAQIKGIDRLHVAFREQDKLLGQRSTLTLSTTASAKGYDAYCVLLASANDFDRDVIGRINFYVGCTRAIEYLEVFAHRHDGVVVEWEKVLARQRETTGA